MQIKTIDTSSLANIPVTTWEKLAQKQIFFGHQSVGYNLVEGIGDLLKSHPNIQLNITETTTPWDVETPGLIHFQIGENLNPERKINDFSDFFDKRNGKKVDIAFFKFCYVDILGNSNVEQLFLDYKKVMDRLVKAHPETTFIYVTVPLTTEPDAFHKFQNASKNWVKSWFNRSTYDVSENIRRDQFNQLLRQEYGATGRLFDLAKFESTLPDGVQQSGSWGGQTYAALVPAYTTDGGHLNQVGRDWVAEHLLMFLAGQVK